MQREDDTAQAARIGYFGGSFDPPHRGHLAVAQAARDAFSLDRVLLAPVGKQPLKAQAPSASFADRLAMVEQLAQGSARLEASAADAPRPDGLPNYTIDTLRQLHGAWCTTPGLVGGCEPRIFVIVGADAFLDLPRWREPDVLLQAADWIVVSRPSTDRDRLRAAVHRAANPERIHLLEGVDVPFSATAVRESLARGVDCKRLLTPEVLAYIWEHHLYGV